MNDINKKILESRLSILVGKNASGKTSILDRLKEQSFNQDTSNLIISFESPINRYLILKSNSNNKLDKKRSYFTQFNFKKIYENFLNRETFKIKSSEKDKIFEASIENLNKKLKDFQKNTELKIYEKYIDKDKYDTRIYFQNNKTYKKLSGSSSGLKSLILILFNIELLKGLLKESSKKSNIFIFLDEPESYIHPAWQKKLTEYLVSFYTEYEQVTIVYSTHSPYMISKKYIDNIYIVEYNEEIKVTPLLNVALNTDNLEINVFQPIEDSLGFKFDIFNPDNPFITVEGQQEYSLFESLIYLQSNNFFYRIINIQGSTNLSPYILVANSVKGVFKSLFVLDADVNIEKDFKGISSEVIKNLKQHFLFIGKDIYTYDEYTKLKFKNECLEDFFANKVFRSYDDIKNIIEQLIKEYKLDCENNKIEEKFKKDIKLNDFLNCYSNQINNMNFKKILNCLCNSFNFEDYECNDNNKKEVGKIFKIERGILKHNKKGLYEKIKKKIFEKARQHENYKFSLEYLQNKIEETLKKFS